MSRLGKAVFTYFFALNKFSQPNGWLSPVACHTYLESSCISGQFKLSGNHFSASYDASESCWQISFNFLQHLKPCHMSYMAQGFSSEASFLFIREACVWIWWMQVICNFAFYLTRTWHFMFKYHIPCLSRGNQTHS